MDRKWCAKKAAGSRFAGRNYATCTAQQSQHLDRSTFGTWNKFIKTAYFTICARNYLAYALTLRESLLEADPDLQFFVFLADDPIDGEKQAGVTIAAAQLNLPDLEQMCFRYTVMEFATAIKPFCFEHLFNHMGFEAAIYLDPDIQVFAPLDAVQDSLANGASCVLTPHLLKPLMDGMRPNDLDILRSGTFNLGFAAFRNTPQSLEFLEWWGRQLAVSGYNDLERGLFVDQKFMELAPSFLPDLHILRNPGYNVAYWNLLHRPVTYEKGTWRAAGQPLVFFHCSGVVPHDPSVFSKHQTRFDMNNSGAAADLVRQYLKLLGRHDQPYWTKIPYAFNHFEDGTKIAPVMRRDSGLKGPAKNWFKGPRSEYWNQPSERVDQASGITITRLMLAIYDTRPDLRAAYPIASETGRRNFHAWFIANAEREGASKADLEAALGRPARSRARQGGFYNTARQLSRPLHRLAPGIHSTLKSWAIRRSR